ncbi:MAG: PRC-barrel domain-containing protein [Candidatus Thorarchaeota archaeon]
MMKKKVVDTSGEEIGNVNDFVISKSKNKIALKSIVLGGGRIEEFLESIGVKPNRDPVFQLDCISQIQEDGVYLTTKGASLKNTLDEGSIGKNDMRLTKFSKLPIVDTDGMKIGNIIDVWFDINGEPWLVAGGGTIEETLERIGVQPDIDLLIPMDYISDMGSKSIKLKYTKFQLESTCEDEYEKYKREVSSRHQPGDSRYAALKFNPKPQGLL